MPSVFTFGVEMEFCLAYLEEGEPPLAQVNPDESRQVYFPATAIDIEETEQRFYEDGDRGPLEPYQLSMYDYTLAFQAVKRTIISLLRTRGLPADPLGTGYADPNLWDVKADGSVSGPDYTPYRWFPMEVTSPALPFTPASLKAVSDVCSLITSRFITETNFSTGLHVHISGGAKPFKFSTMKNLLVFLWAFEPQLSTIHPPIRQSNGYCEPMRSRSSLVSNFEDKWGASPSPLQGAVELIKSKDMPELLETAVCCTRSKMMTCNVLNALQFVTHPEETCVKPTLEFRQHEGTLDGERIIRWVSLLVGIVQRLEEIHPESLLDLFSLARYEKWEKFNGAEATNSENEARFGPVPAESSFTIIDLLEWLGLDESANYYRDRVFEVAGRPEPDHLSVREFVPDASDTVPNRSYEHLKAEFVCLRDLWQSMKLVVASAQEVEGAQVDFDPHGPLWPKNCWLNPPVEEIDYWPVTP